MTIPRGSGGRNNDRKGASNTHSKTDERESSQTRWTNNPRRHQTSKYRLQFPEYWSLSQCEGQYSLGASRRGKRLHTVQVIRGKLRVVPLKDERNQKDSSVALVTCDQSQRDVLIGSFEYQNRGMDGDTVYVEILTNRDPRYHNILGGTGLEQHCRGVVVHVLPPSPADLEQASDGTHEMARRPIIGYLTIAFDNMCLLTPENQSLPQFLCPFGTAQKIPEEDLESRLYQAEYIHGSWKSEHRRPPCVNLMPAENADGESQSVHATSGTEGEQEHE
jgi:hypothetical protein